MIYYKAMPPSACAHCSATGTVWDDDSQRDVRMMDLRGSVPNMTGGVPSEDFVRDLRDDWRV
jgi:hypothetical protein